MTTPGLNSTDGNYRIEADVMIPGRGDPVNNATVCFEHGAITYAGARANAPTPDPNAGQSVVEVNTVMPGLWDCHVHFVGNTSANLAELGTTNPITATARAAADVTNTLMGGVTSVRDVGGLGLHMAPAVEQGRLVGPTIHAAGRVLSTTGGHGDIHGYPLDFVHSITCSHSFGLLCDGVPEVLKAVRTNLRSNAKLIKICASGGVMSEIDDPIHQQFSDEELAAIVAEAGRAERIVAAHCHGKPGIVAALRAGCHTIEHGSYLDEEAAELMVETGAVLVPTRFVVDELLGQADVLPRWAYEKGQQVADVHEQAMKIAIAKGVKVAAGCDIFMSGTDMYGRNGSEIRHLINAGMTDLQAIEAATATAPETLGPQAPKSGQLTVGYDADVISFDVNPLDDRTIWGDRSRLTSIWKGGQPVLVPTDIG